MSYLKSIALQWHRIERAQCKTIPATRQELVVRAGCALICLSTSGCKKSGSINEDVFSHFRSRGLTYMQVINSFFRCCNYLEWVSTLAHNARRRTLSVHGGLGKTFCHEF